MDKSVVDSLGLWLALILAAITLSIWAVLMSVQGQYSRYQQSEIDAIEQVREYREWNTYDNTQVYAQDVASIVLKTRGSIQIWVDTDINPATETWGIVWDNTTLATEFTAAKISALLPVNGMYNSSIIKDVNGSISRLEFRR